MNVFVFDLLAYGENLEHLKTGSELPSPLSKRHFKADRAVRTYAEHLDAWEEIDRLSYDGAGANTVQISLNRGAMPAALPAALRQHSRFLPLICSPAKTTGCVRQKSGAQ